MNVEPRAPDHVANTTLIGRRAAPIQQGLHEIRRRHFGRVVNRRHDTKMIVGKRRDHHQAVGRVKQRYFLPAQRPFHADIGQHETLLIRRTDERDAG